MVAVLKIVGGCGCGVQRGDEQRAGGRDRGPLKGSRLQTEWEKGKGRVGALAAEASRRRWG